MKWTVKGKKGKGRV